MIPNRFPTIPTIPPVDPLAAAKQIDEANARLAENPKFVLGKQVGFVEPERSKDLPV
jgi:hypothetical protein